MEVSEKYGKGRLGRFWHGLKRQLYDATSVSAMSTPIKAVTDQFAGMTDAESIGARAWMIGLNYLGLVQLIRVRDWSKRKFGIAESKRRVLHWAHDGAFALGMAPIQAGVYIKNGVDSWEQAAVTIVLSALVLGAFGGPFGQGIDGYRELMGGKESVNSPRFVKRVGEKYKKAVGVALVAGLLALTAGLYAVIPNRAPEDRSVQTSGIERMVDDAYSGRIVSRESGYVREFESD